MYIFLYIRYTVFCFYGVYRLAGLVFRDRFLLIMEYNVNSIFWSFWKVLLGGDFVVKIKGS